MSRYHARLAAAQATMQAKGVDALCVSVGSDLPYLTGYAAMASERLTMLVVPAEADPVLVIPQLEAPRVRTDHDLAIRAWMEWEDPIAIVADLLGGVSAVAVGDQTWSTFTLALQTASSAAVWVSAGAIMRDLRIRKSSDEVDDLREAARAADRVIDELGHVRFSGRSERDVGREIAERLLAAGHDTVDFTIVAAGPHGASPHHELSDRMIQHGEAVVVDIGGHRNGYASDTTRMFIVGDAPVGFDDAYTVLRAAQAAACGFVAPGVTASAVDAVARSIIEDAGYGDLFIHRLGHGIGMDTHEDPYLVAGNDTVLEAGMAFSVEPGIYVPDAWGMRIEDIVAVTEDGMESLNETPRTYRIVT